MLQEKLKKEMVEAMKSGDSLKRDTLRMVLSSITNELVSKKKKPTESLDDADVIKVLRKLVKQRGESIDLFTKAGNDEQAKKETDEKNILNLYLPEDVPEEKIKQIVERIAKENNFSDSKDMGNLIKLSMMELKKEFGDGVDGSVVSKIVNLTLN